MFLLIKRIEFVLLTLCVSAFKAQEASALIGRNRNLNKEASDYMKSPKAKKSPKTKAPKSLNLHK
jgi:hypothetical protein